MSIITINYMTIKTPAEHLVNISFLICHLALRIFVKQIYLYISHNVSNVFSNWYMIILNLKKTRFDYIE